MKTIIKKSIILCVTSIIILIGNPQLTNASYSAYNELQYVYSVEGLLTEVKDENGKILYTFEYDENCNLVQIIKQI